MDERSLINLIEAATLLGLSRHTLKAWIRSRRLPHYKLGRRVLLSKNDIEKYLAQSRVEAIGVDHAA